MERKDRIYLGHKPMGTVNYKDMSVEEQRAYKREATKRHRSRMTPEEKARQREVSLRWAKNNPELYREAIRRKQVKRQFGITLERYLEIMTGASCVICLSAKN